MSATNAKSSEKPAPAKRPANVREKAAAKADAPAHRRKTKGNGALSDTERRNCVEVAAYYIAQRRGFSGGSALEDWLQAEQEVDRLLGKQQSGN